MSNTHTFAPGVEDLVVVDLVPPAGVTAVTVKFTATMPTASGPAGGVRLAHVRLLHPAKHPNETADQALPRESEICELIVRNGALTAGFSGFGGKHAAHPVQHLGDAPGSFPVVITVPLNGKGVVVSAGAHVATSDTDIAPGERPMQLLLGMAPLAHGDGVSTLSPPLGWAITWEDDAVTWIGGAAQAAPAPAAAPLIDLVKAELAKRSDLYPAEVDLLSGLLSKLLGGA